MLLLPGCELKQSGEKASFGIKHSHRLYNFQLENESKLVDWMAVLDLAVKAKTQLGADEK
jgi:hypothetical protein